MFYINDFQLNALSNFVYNGLQIYIIAKCHILQFQCSTLCQPFKCISLNFCIYSEPESLSTHPSSLETLLF
jgi:hypothetical protein